MSIQAVVEYSDKGFLIYADSFPGAFARGKEKNEALNKLPQDVERYCRWAGRQHPKDPAVDVIQEVYKDIAIEDADSEVIFDSEKLPLSDRDYRALKYLILKSAEDVFVVFDSIPEKGRPLVQPRKTFYGDIPATAFEMLLHINQVTEYYMAQVGVSIDNLHDLCLNRESAFSALENIPDFLDGGASIGSFGEEWSLRKVLRRFLWHDRIHVRAMYKRADLIWEGKIKNPFCFT